MSQEDQSKLAQLKEEVRALEEQQRREREAARKRADEEFTATLAATGRMPLGHG